MTDPGRESRDVTLGRHDATLQHQQEEIAELKASQAQASNKLDTALSEFRNVTLALYAETAKNKWTRRGAFLALSVIFALLALIIRQYPDLATAIIKWLSSHQAPQR